MGASPRDVPHVARASGALHYVAQLSDTERDRTHEHAIVVGAGPAGLAAAVELGRRRVPAVVLERGDAVGASWHTRYDRLRLNSSRWFSQLPGARFGRATGVFPSRAEIVRYLERYATRFEIDVRLSTAVERIDADGDGWLVRTTRGDLSAGQVIVATGHLRVGAVPEWPGRERFGGALLHACDYRNPEPYQGADVLVVGPGCTGMEIAYDLAVGGARRVRLAIRTPPNILVRAPSASVTPVSSSASTPATTSTVPSLIASIHSLSTIAGATPSRRRRLKTPSSGIGRPCSVRSPSSFSRTLRATASARSDGSFASTRANAGPAGARIEPDAVIAATGYTRGLEPIVGHLGVLDENGTPRVREGEAAAPGLRFVGFTPRPAQLGYLGGEARTAAKGIAREMRGATRSPVPVLRRAAMSTRG